MKQFKAVLFFYVKILIPTVIISTLFAFSDRYVSGLMPVASQISTQIKPELFSLRLFVISFYCFALLFHYIVYEVRYKNEYYFYYNLGLSKLSLWVSNLILTSIITTITVVLWIIFI